MRFLNSNGITCSDEKRVEGKSAKSSECSLYYERENAMHTLTEIVLNYMVTLFISFVVEVFILCFMYKFCKHYTRHNGKIKCRLALNLKISRDREILLTPSIHSQFYCIIRH